MLYAFLGSSLAGALASALLLWRLSAAKLALASARAELDSARWSAESWKSSYQTAVDTYKQREAQCKESLDRAATELATVEKQRDEALTKLVQSGAPGSIADLLRTRASAATSSVPSASKPSKS